MPGDQIFQTPVRRVVCWKTKCRSQDCYQGLLPSLSVPGICGYWQQDLFFEPRTLLLLACRVIPYRPVFSKCWRASRKLTSPKSFLFSNSLLISDLLLLADPFVIVLQGPWLGQFGCGWSRHGCRRSAWSIFFKVPLHIINSTWRSLLLLFRTKRQTWSNQSTRVRILFSRHLNYTIWQFLQPLITLPRHLKVCFYF